MIYCLTTAEHQYTFSSYLQSDGASLRRELKLLSYEQLWKRRAKKLPLGTYVFSDLERLSPREAERAVGYWEMLEQRGCRLLNHPTRVMRRFELLRSLHLQGINDANVYRLTEREFPLNYPVFLRCENDHGGAETDLLADEPALVAAIDQLRVSGKSREDRIVTEFCDTSQAGMYRKYSAFVLAGRVIARHLLFGDHWMLKYPEQLSPETLAEERAYVEGNPHADFLAGVFEQAGVDYGRIDYGVRDGRIQVWEINTNPMITTPEDRLNTARLPVQDCFAPQLLEAWRAVRPHSTGAGSAWRLLGRRKSAA